METPTPLKANPGAAPPAAKPKSNAMAIGLGVGFGVAILVTIIVLALWGAGVIGGSTRCTEKKAWTNIAQIPNVGPRVLASRDGKWTLAPINLKNEDSPESDWLIYSVEDFRSAVFSFRGSVDDMSTVFYYGDINKTRAIATYLTAEEKGFLVTADLSDGKWTFKGKQDLQGFSLPDLGDKGIITAIAISQRDPTLAFASFQFEDGSSPPEVSSAVFTLRYDASKALWSPEDRVTVSGVPDNAFVVYNFLVPEEDETRVGVVYGRKPDSGSGQAVSRVAVIAKGADGKWSVSDERSYSPAGFNINEGGLGTSISPDGNRLLVAAPQEPAGKVYSAVVSADGGISAGSSTSRPDDKFAVVFGVATAIDNDGRAMAISQNYAYSFDVTTPDKDATTPLQLSPVVDVEIDYPAAFPIATGWDSKRLLRLIPRSYPIETEKSAFYCSLIESQCS